MTTIKLVGAHGVELARIAFEGPPSARRVYPTSSVDQASLLNVLMLALVTHVADFHDDGEEVEIPIAPDRGAIDDGHA